MNRFILLIALCVLVQKANAQPPETALFSLPLRHLKLTSSFGNRMHPILRSWKMHNGIDLSARSDTVFCVLDGVVSHMGYDQVLGVFIRVEHENGFQTTYGHLRTPWVSAGDSVLAGQAIGITGGTGRVTGEHLHFGVRFQGAPCDPLHLLRTLFRVNGQIN